MRASSALGGSLADPPWSVREVPLDRPTDALLVAAARDGDLRAKEALFRRYAGTALGMAYRLLGRDAEIEDVVQDSFTAAFGSLHKLSEPKAFPAWFAAIVTGCAIRVLRRRRVLSRVGLRRPDPVQLERLISASAPPDVALELRDLYAAIDRLPADEWAVLVLRRVDELPLEDIAQRTGWSLATVKRRLRSAQQHLEEATGRSEGRP